MKASSGRLHRLSIFSLCYVLTLRVYCREQFFSDRFNQDTGFPDAEVPPNMQEEARKDIQFYDDLHFIKRSYYDFIQGLKERKLINHPKVEELFLKVRRADFINVKPHFGFSNIPYCFDNQVQMELPSYVSLILEQLVDHIHNGSRVLEIGSGQGFITTCLGHLVGTHGKVYGLEHDPKTCNDSLKNIRIASPELLRRGNLEIVEKDGRWGHAEGGPYDAIFYGAGTSEVSETILSQLKPNGRIVAPVGNIYRQNLTVIDKHLDGSIRSHVVKAVSQDFLCTWLWQVHPEEFYEPQNISDNDPSYFPMFTPGRGGRYRDQPSPLDGSAENVVEGIPASPASNETLQKYTFIPESLEDKHVFHQELLDLLHGPNKTKSLRKKNTKGYFC